MILGVWGWESVRNTELTVVYVPGQIPVMHSLYPLLTTSAKRRCNFVHYSDFNPDKCHSEAVVFVRVARAVEREHLHGLLERSKRTFNILNYFDDGDGPGAPLSIEDLDKLRLAWNIGIGSYPLSRRRDRLVRRTMEYISPKLGGVFMTRPRPPRSAAVKRQNVVSARFAWENRNDITGKHRQTFHNTLRDDDRFLHGVVSPKKYRQELASVRAVFSPFGYGEICFRDFEATHAGAVLIKPDMSHLQTWPNIFEPNVTYQPVHWDGSDAVARSLAILQDHRLAEYLVGNAQKRMVQAYEVLDNVAHSFVDQYLSRKAIRENPLRY